MKTIAISAALLLAASAAGSCAAQEFEAQYVPKTCSADTLEANKRVVLGFYQGLEDGDKNGDMKTRIAGVTAKYIAPGYIQHKEGGKSGRDALTAMFQSMPAMTPKMAYVPPKIVAITADCDHVIMVTSREMTNPQTQQTTSMMIWNMFRIENGQLAEHWDSSPSMGGMGGMPPAGAPGGAPGGPPPGIPGQ